MPWKGETLESIRYNFILATQNDRVTFSDLCKAYGISRKTGYKWLLRFSEGGREALTDVVRAPFSRPRDVSQKNRNSIIDIAYSYPRWGAIKLKRILENEHPDIDWPSVTTFGNILKKEGLTKRRRIRYKMAKTTPVQDVSECNGTWCADFKGWWVTNDRKICEPFTVTDLHSRFILGCELVKNRKFQSVWKILEGIFYEFGMPDRFRTDNGSPYASNAVGRLSRMAVKLIRLGVTPEWITPGKPQENGIHERMHRTLKLEAATPPSNTRGEQIEVLNNFRDVFNFKRPHEALDLNTPSDIYVPSKKLWTGEESDPTYGEGYEERRVDSKGSFRWRGSSFFLTEILQKEKLGIKESAANIFEVSYSTVVLGHIKDKKFVRA